MIPSPVKENDMPLTADQRRLVEIFEVLLPEMVRTRNIPGYVDLFTDNGAWMPASGTDCFGKEQIALAVSRLLDQESIDPTFTAQEVWVHGDKGYVLGYSEEHIRPRDGSPAYTAWSRELWCFQRVQDDFKIVRLMFDDKASKEQLGTGPVSSCTICDRDSME